MVAMQFTDEVVWSWFDVLVMGLLLFGAGTAFVLISRRGPGTTYRVAVGLAVASTLLLIWMNLAVGIIGAEDNPANLLYAGVVAVELVGIGLARLRPHGMQRALLATAAAQFLVPVTALIVWRPPLDTADAVMGVMGVFILNSFFVALFVAAALLFRRARRSASAPPDAAGAS
ncbi:hypothetical protein GF314_08575 [bacterium]|nr:hypothetical protein [bacterium]